MPENFCYLRDTVREEFARAASVWAVCLCSTHLIYVFATIWITEVTFGKALHDGPGIDTLNNLPNMIACFK